MYAYNVRWHTTTAKTPKEIHEIGLAEVKRIRAGMDAIIAKVGFKGSYDDFKQFLRTNPAFYYTRRRGARLRLSRRGQARRPGAGAPVRHAAADAVRRSPACRTRRRRRRPRRTTSRGARRRPPRQHVREHVQARRAAEVGDGGADAARGRARPSSADRARAGARGPSGVPQEHELHGVRRRLGALRREPRRRDGLLPGSVLEVRPAHLRHVARGPARRRHRAALDGMDAPAGDRLLRGQRREDAAGHHRRGRPLHRLAGPGGRLQDGPAEDPRAAHERRAPARAGVRRARVPRRRARAGRGALDVLERRVAEWVASLR